MKGVYIISIIEGRGCGSTFITTIGVVTRSVDFII